MSEAAEANLALIDARRIRRPAVLLCGFLAVSPRARELERGWQHLQLTLERCQSQVARGVVAALLDGLCGGRDKVSDGRSLKGFGSGRTTVTSSPIKTSS